jgi:hypothetical protein
MSRSNQLEPLEDGYVAFRTGDGERWKHKDMTEGRAGEGYRVFISNDGEQRRYRFGPDEPHDATLEDLRDQLRQADAAPGPASGSIPE